MSRQQRDCCDLYVDRKPCDCPDRPSRKPKRPNVRSVRPIGERRAAAEVWALHGWRYCRGRHVYNKYGIAQDLKPTLGVIELLPQEPCRHHTNASERGSCGRCGVTNAAVPETDGVCDACGGLL